MTDHSPAGSLAQAQEQARALLADRYANDWIDQEELDRRLEALEGARSPGELQALTADLRRPGAEAALVPIERAAPPMPIKVIGATAERLGTWRVAAHTQVGVLLGSAILDLRAATLPDGPIHLELKVTLGSLEVIVPPGWQIDNQCGAVLSSVEHDASHAPAQGSRALLLTGRVVLGSLAIQERLPGEDAGDARRRRKRERKALRAQRALPRGRA